MRRSVALAPFGVGSQFCLQAAEDRVTTVRANNHSPLHTDETSHPAAARFTAHADHQIRVQATGGYLSDVSPFATGYINRSVFVPGSPYFGMINQFFPSNSRQVQIVARFVF